jgi:type II restriction/modification system DNA methylase subunit YeeA
LKSEQIQAIKDRETFKKDPAALIKAARERRRTTNDKIANILTSDQKKAFQNYIFSGFIETPTLLLVERLSLTLDQTDSVKTIMEISQQNMEQIKTEYPNNRRLRFEEMRKNMQETNNKIKDILSDEQKKIYQKLIAERQQNQRSRMMGRRGGRGRRR